MTYRKRPVEIEAFQFRPVHRSGFGVCAEDAPLWFLEAEQSRKAHIWTDDEEPYCMITTLEGKMKAMPGDWIIKGVKDEIYPCKPDIFAATYEEVINIHPTEESMGT